MSLDQRLLSALVKAIDGSEPAVLVTLVDVKGSAPRDVGTSMLVMLDRMVGTIGGGRLEFVAMQAAHEFIKESNLKSHRQRYPLGDALGQCCGGSVELLFENVGSDWLTWVNDAQAALLAHQLYIRDSGESYSHRVEPLPAQLVLCGAGHVGRALVEVLADAPINIHWVDEREAEFPLQTPVNVICEVSDSPEIAIEQARPGSAVLITTHRHDLDFKLASAAIERGDLVYCGLIGSKSKRGGFERLWRQRGGRDSALDFLTCPIGLNGPHGKDPKVLAIAVASEILTRFTSVTYS